jgi:hypothetical protein
LVRTARISGTPIALTPELAMPIEISPAMTLLPCLISRSAAAIARRMMRACS